MSSELVLRVVAIAAGAFTVAAISDALQYGFEVLRKATEEPEPDEQGSQDQSVARRSTQA